MQQHSINMGKIDYSKYKVSVIIPVYNAEKYLEECIASILQQKHRNLEIILVDDESTDNSPQIIERQCGLDKRFVHIRISNHGPAYARNIGLDRATGDYILFLDNDDLLAPNAISKLCRKAVQSKAEVVVGNTLCFDDETCYLYRERYKGYERTMSGTDFFGMVLENGNYTVMLYNYIYSRSFIEKHRLRFDSNVIHEDELWTPMALGYAIKILPTHIIHYYYRQRKDSLSRNIPQNIQKKELAYISAKLENFAYEQEEEKLIGLMSKRIKQLESYIYRSSLSDSAVDCRAYGLS